MSSLQGTGAEGTYRQGGPSSRCGDQLCPPARLTPYLGLCMARVPCPRANQISPWGPISSAPLPWLSPCLSTAWPDAPDPLFPASAFTASLGPACWKPLHYLGLMAGLSRDLSVHKPAHRARRPHVAGWPAVRKPVCPCLPQVAQDPGARD